MTYVYSFDHSHDRPAKELAALLGGKGANLAEMSSALGLPVPPGFTISTEACTAYLKEGWPAGLDDEIAHHVAQLEARMGRQLGDPASPLLVSVRSGARFSMPGMMDTVLNLGLNDESVEGLTSQTDRRFALDSYRRFIKMYGRIVLGIPGEEFDRRLEDARELAGVATDGEVPADILEGLIKQFKDVVEAHTKAPFPQEPQAQLRAAVEAVFSSWRSPRAVAYRTRERIPHDLGTAVNVQSMVFGNRDDNSGTGVGFTRNPATGEAGAYGDFLVNAQGEDVVAGIRATEPLSALSERFPAIYDQLLDIFDRLERHYRDMLDTEFTIERGRLWMLQTRVGKRTGAAALRIAVAMTNDPRIGLSREEALLRVSGEHLDQVLHPTFEHTAQVVGRGLPASPGAAVGKVYFTADKALDAHNRGEDVILVRVETSPEDVHGMEVSKGVLTSRGGLVSHAAVVARGWGIPAVVGAEQLEIGDRSFKAGDVVVSEGETISIDGSAGAVMLGALEMVDTAPPAEFDTILGWADEVRAGNLGVRANADTAADAARARSYGAEGIGLCRTEHMFLGPERLPVVRRAILASTPQEEEQALAELGKLQRADFEEILEAMDGLPVTVRLLDPPLHEFLPSLEDVLAAEAAGTVPEEDRKLYEAAREWREQNPMLGTRGVRLGVIRPGLYRMQVRALAQAAAARVAAGGHPKVEVMIPLVVAAAELAHMRQMVEAEVATTQPGRPLDLSIGTMIETPRAALRAEDIGQFADFFSFGTNDLTQLTFGFSRDDVEGRIMGTYLDEGLLPRNPFETVDAAGVGELVRLGTERGRRANPRLKVGVCGEHGGDPESIRVFCEAGLDYVSCSPFRVPVARLAAAQAVLMVGGMAEAASTR
ncbi:MAG: pyruvate, orthophosphate dikinase [Acidimicrobiia bacterium]|nr:pyruvate, orthophosphate dikinase [Acidimicrobiia bacterium]